MRLQINPNDLSDLKNLPLPRYARTWLTRGYLRCSLLNDLQANDDMDVIVAISPRELEEYVAPLSFRRTIHGGFSLKTGSTRKIDVWALTQTFGHNCENIQQALSLFEFSCDALAFDLASNELVMTEVARPLLTTREFDIQSAPKDEMAKDFYLTKAIYLIARHNLLPGPGVARMFLTTNADERIRHSELAAHFGQDLKDMGRTNGASALLKDFPSLASRIQVMMGKQN